MKIKKSNAILDTHWKSNMLQVANNRREMISEQLTRVICNQGEEEGCRESQTDEQRTVFFLRLFGQSWVAEWVPVLQRRLSQAMLDQAGAKGEQAKGPSTTQTPVLPQWATLGPCGLASGAGRQHAGALFSSSFACSLHFLFDLHLPLALSPSLFSLHVCRFRLFSLYPVNLFPLPPSNILTVSIAKFHQSSGRQSGAGWEKWRSLCREDVWAGSKIWGWIEGMGGGGCMVLWQVDLF